MYEIGVASNGILVPNSVIIRHLVQYLKSDEQIASKRKDMNGGFFFQHMRTAA